MNEKYLGGVWTKAKIARMLLKKSYELANNLELTEYFNCMS